MKYLLLIFLASSTFAFQYNNCQQSGPVCSNQQQTFTNACACQQAGQSISHLGVCGSSSNYWLPQFDQKVIGKAPEPIDLSDSRINWGWNKPTYKKHIPWGHGYINWKFDNVLNPVYDFSYVIGPYSPQARINYNYDNWNWGNWRWLNDVQGQKSYNTGMGCCNTCVNTT